MKRERPDSPELLRRIAKLSADADWNPQETSEVLRQAGIDPEDFGNRIVEQVKRLTRESPLHWHNKAEAKRLELLNQVKQRVGNEAVQLTKSELLDRIRCLMQNLPTGGPVQNYAVAFRKFEEAEEEDLRSMFEELTLLRELGEDETES